MPQGLWAPTCLPNIVTGTRVKGWAAPGPGPRGCPVGDVEAAAQTQARRRRGQGGEPTGLPKEEEEEEEEGVGSGLPPSDW